MLAKVLPPDQAVLRAESKGQRRCSMARGQGAESPMRLAPGPRVPDKRPAVAAATNRTTTGAVSRGAIRPNLTVARTSNAQQCRSTLRQTST